MRESLPRIERALILGFGRSGRAALELLLGEGVPCRVADASAAGERTEDGIIHADDDVGALAGVDLLVKSPGVSRSHALVTEALKRGVRVWGELELGARVAAAPLLTITGSNGKTTTTALTAHLLRSTGVPAIAAGNIGQALCAVAKTADPAGAIVVEASSFQAEDLVSYRSRVAALLNVTPDHLDRHGSFEAYLAAKERLVSLVERGGHRVLNGDDAALADMVAAWRRTDARHTLVVQDARHGGRGAWLEGSDIVVNLGTPRSAGTLEGLRLPGAHNRANALVATAIVSAFLGRVPDVTEGLASFAPLPHRLEPVGAVGGVTFVNDSKATNLDSVGVALRAFAGTPVVLIAGGRDKGGPFESYQTLVRTHVTTLVLIGEAAERIENAWPDVPSERAPDMASAVVRALALAGGRGVVLLSPGCASFDMFDNYEARGDAFRAAVRRLVEEKA